MAARAYEVNFDGLVGPTHNYAGLSYGNLASQRSSKSASDPRAAALEGLRKMKLLADLGVKQAVLPPHERPDVEALRRLGFSGSDADVLWRAKQADPVVLASCCSASAMWTANAATVSPSADTADGRVHFTPANLVSQSHRALEPATTAAVLKAIFADPEHFAHHPPLPSASAYGDEGAANYARLAPSHGDPGIELFVYGRRAFDPAAPAPARFPARQTREASEAVVRLHGLNRERVVLSQQNPAAIDAGVFHNDVISVGNENVFLYHADAFADPDAVIRELAECYAALGRGEFIAIRISSDHVPLQEAVSTYLFNSQLVTMPNGSMSLIAPEECAESPSIRHALARLVGSGTPIKNVHFVNVRQSMRNGGGPACLRLRVVLNDAELASVGRQVILTDALYAQLTDWVTQHYREHLSAGDLADPALLEEGRAALDRLTQILGLGSVYRFQHK